MTETASPASIGYGSQDTLSEAGLPAGATGTVTFTSGGSTLCTALLPATSCQTSATLGAGTYPVTATYSGDANYKGTIATGASFMVTRTDPVFTEFGSAREHSVRHGRYAVHNRPACRRHRNGDLHLGRIDPLHRGAAGDEL